MTNWVCAGCGAQVSPGAPRCPECPSTSFIKPEADVSLKISRDGTVSDSAAVREHPAVVAVDASLAYARSADALAALAALDDAGPEVTEAPEPAAEVPAEPQAPDAAPGPAPVPSRPPLRVPPPGA